MVMVFYGFSLFLKSMSAFFEWKMDSKMVTDRRAWWGRLQAFMMLSTQESINLQELTSERKHCALLNTPFSMV